MTCWLEPGLLHGWLWSWDHCITVAFGTGVTLFNLELMVAVLRTKVRMYVRSTCVSFHDLGFKAQFALELFYIVRWHNRTNE